MQQLIRRLDDLIAIKNQETNRLEGIDQVVAIRIRTHVRFLDKQISEVKNLISEHIEKHQDLRDRT